MRGILHVPFRDECVGFHVMAEVSIREKDAFDRSQVRAREERVTRMKAYSARKDPDVFRYKVHGLVTLLLRQIGHVNTWL